jgi:hypothetical protein
MKTQSAAKKVETQEIIDDLVAQQTLLEQQSKEAIAETKRKSEKEIVALETEQARQLASSRKEQSIKMQELEQQAKRLKKQMETMSAKQKDIAKIELARIEDEQKRLKKEAE